MRIKMDPIEEPKFNRAGYQINSKDLNGEPLPNTKKLLFRPFKLGRTRVKFACPKL
jgi:hypothetical protein